MNVLIVTQYFWPENFRINDMATELKLRGHSVTVLTGIPNYPTGKVLKMYRDNPARFDEYLGVPVKRVPMISRGNGSLRLFMNYVSFVISACLLGPSKLRGLEPDVIFVYEPSPVTVGLPALLFGKIKNVPVVFWALDLWPDTLQAIGAVRSPAVLRLIGYLVQFIYERCTLVLGQSRGFLSKISNYCSDSRKIRYFPSWSEDIFDTPKVKPAPELERKTNVFNVLFAGNIGEAQDIPSLLAAAEKLKGMRKVRWIIVGDGRMSHWLEKEVERRGLGNEFVLLGRFPIERMPSFYQHADALLVSLKRDPVFSLTIPAKLQSYLLSGIPILGMLDGEGARIIKETNCGLVCSAGDSSGLASAIKKMAAMDHKTRHSLGLKGKSYAKNQFDRSLLMNKLENLLDEAVSLHRLKNKPKTDNRQSG